MKTNNIITVLMMLALLVSCGRQQEEAPLTGDLPEQEDTLMMNSDTLYAHVVREVNQEISRRRSSLSREALATLGETRVLLQTIERGDTVRAIELGHKLIGELEVMLARDPSLSQLLVDVDYQKIESVADIATVRNVVKLAREAMKKGYYRQAAGLLENMKSEIVISNYYIPTATYPEGIKVATALLEEGKSEAAKAVLYGVLTTILVEKTILPLPVLKAHEMVAEAARLDAEDHANSAAVLNLLHNANYQLHLAEEMGYGKRDKEYALLYDRIRELERSVGKKENSTSKFDSLKQEMKEFQERLFPKNSQK
jgi:ribosome-binding protein aMBF1 (putative translation factor)